MQGAATQVPGLKGMEHAGDTDGAGGDGRLRGGIDSGSPGTDHYGDCGGSDGGCHQGSSNANGEKNSREGTGTSLKANPLTTASELHRLFLLDTPW